MNIFFEGNTKIFSEVNDAYCESLNRIFELDNVTKSEEVNLQSLSMFQNILLTTNGTITNILEAYLCEKIYSNKLVEKLIDLKHENQILFRSVTLKGKNSKKNCIYAGWISICNKIENKLQRELFET